MKKRFLLLTLIMCLFGGVNFLSLKAQDDLNVVTIDGDKSDQYPEKAGGPFDTYYETSCSQSYYTSTEIEKPEGSIIDKIAYKVSAAATSNAERNIKVWLMNTDADNFGASGIQPGSEATSVLMSDEYLVYNGTYNVGTTGWIEIDIENFTYGGENILVTVYDYTYTKNSDLKFYYFSSMTTSDNDTKGYYRSLFRSNTDPTKTNILYKECKYTPALQLTFVGGGEPETPETPKAPALVSPTNGTTIGGTTVNLSWSYGENNTATHYQVSLGTDSENLSVITDGWVERTGLGTGDIATEDEFSNVNLEYGNTYYWRVDVRNGEGDPVGGEVWSFATPASAAFEFITEGNWNVGANWNGGAVPGNGAIVVLNANATITAEDNINVADLTILEGASLTINGSLTITGEFSNTDASKLVINDGGQIFQTNTDVKATFNMNINNPTEWSENNIDGWQFISSPFTDASINNFVTTGVGNDYDLYKFDGKQVGAEWQNQKAIATFEEEFVSGRGYLASYEKAATATLNGTLNTSTILDLSLSYAGSTLADLYLIGNPFPFDMDMSKLDGMTYHITEGYAVVNNGSYSYYNLEGTIPAGDGFFVKVTDDNPSLYYNHNAKSSRSGNANSLNITATGNAGNDNVVVNFNGEGEGFPKLQNFNDAIATVYVQNNDVNYAIFNCNEDVQEIELCFNANQMGNYTISVEPTGEFSSIVLVDRFTGIETNLLVEDYRFTAMSEENNNRFFIRLGNGQQSTDNSHFAYVSGEDLIIEAEGTVQIIDMMGRVVYTSNVENNNRIDVSEFNNGAYVVRVINENEVKVEKVVVY